MSWNNDVPLNSPCVAPVRELRSHQGLNGRSLRKALRTFCGRHIQCYLDIFLLLGLGSFTWRSLDGIWWQTDRNVNDGLKAESQEEETKGGNTHCARHLIQLAHGLVDSSFQVIIQFPRSVGHISHFTLLTATLGFNRFIALRHLVAAGRGTHFFRTSS